MRIVPQLKKTFVLIVNQEELLIIQNGLFAFSDSSRVQKDYEKCEELSEQIRECVERIK